MAQSLKLNVFLFNDMKFGRGKIAIKIRCAYQKKKAHFFFEG